MTATTASEPRAGEADFHPFSFACGAANPHGLGLSFAIGADGVAEAEWLPSLSYASYAGRVHGGVLATLADSAIVHALRGRGVDGVTAELTVRYRRPVALDLPVQVRGWVESVRRGIFACRAEIRQEGRPVAWARAKFAGIKRP